MEQSVFKADRVLMICTETYVKKADEGKGGAGYEAMIVTGELIKNLGTSKFIPIIRQKKNSYLLPLSIGTRYSANLSEDHNYDAECDALIRTLKNKPIFEKPALGKSTIDKQTEETESQTTVSIDSAIPDFKKIYPNVVDIYNAALALAQNEDLVAWRKALRLIKNLVYEDLEQWREKQNSVSSINVEDLPKIVTEGSTIFTPLFVYALAGIESGKDKFKNQVSILDDILFPKNWVSTGLVVIGDLPDTIAFIFQALYGAMCLQTEQLPLAIDLAQTKLKRRYENDALPLYKISDIIGWPESLGGYCSKAWDFLQRVPENWVWINELFGDPDDYLASLCAYYMALNILELVETVASGDDDIILKTDISLDVPIFFTIASDEVKRKAYKRLLINREDVRSIWTNQEVSESKLKELWPHWTRHARHWVHAVYPYNSHRNIIYEDFFNDLE